MSKALYPSASCSSAWYCRKVRTPKLTTGKLVGGGATPGFVGICSGSGNRVGRSNAEAAGAGAAGDAAGAAGDAGAALTGAASGAGVTSVATGTGAAAGVARAGAGAAAVVFVSFADVCANAALHSVDIMIAVTQTRITLFMSEPLVVYRSKR